MSFNKYEQLLHDYIEDQPEEKRYWVAHVSDLEKARRRREETVMKLNAALWEYFEERSLHESPFKEFVQYEGSGRISMLNLSEYWLRMWTSAGTARSRKKS